MFLIFLSVIFCNQCNWYFESNENKINHDCKIDEINCFYSIRTKEIKDDAEILELKFLENHNNITENLQKLYYFRDEIKNEIRIFEFLKNKNETSIDIEISEDQNTSSENFQFEFISKSIDKCFNGIKKYDGLIENECFFSLLDQKDAIDERKQNFFIEHEHLLPSKSKKKCIFFNFNKNKDSKEYIQLMHEIEKSKSVKNYYKDLFAEQKEVFDHVLLTINKFIEEIHSEFGFDLIACLAEFNKNNTDSKKGDSIASKFLKQMGVLKKRTRIFDKNTNSEEDTVILKPSKALYLKYKEELENENKKSSSEIPNIEELKNKIYIRIKLMLCIFEEIKNSLIFIDSVNKICRDLELEYYSHEISKLEEITTL